MQNSLTNLGGICYGKVVLPQLFHHIFHIFFYLPEPLIFQSAVTVQPLSSLVSVIHLLLQRTAITLCTLEMEEHASH